MGKTNLKTPTYRKHPNAIMALTNSYHYLLSRVVIIQYDSYFRLFVVMNDKAVCDSQYKNSKGAKIAFLKFFLDKKIRPNVKPVWSGEYIPDQAWLSELLNTPAL